MNAPPLRQQEPIPPPVLEFRMPAPRRKVRRQTIVEKVVDKVGLPCILVAMLVVAGTSIWWFFLGWFLIDTVPHGHYGVVPDADRDRWLANLGMAFILWFMGAAPTTCAAIGLGIWHHVYKDDDNDE